MAAMVFMYIEALGRPLAAEMALGFVKDGEWRVSTADKVYAFVHLYMPELWTALERFEDRKHILADTYRNGLVHEIFMKGDAAIHECLIGKKDYVREGQAGCPVSIEWGMLANEFRAALRAYQQRLQTDSVFAAIYNDPACYAKTRLAKAAR